MTPYKSCLIYNEFLQDLAKTFSYLMYDLNGCVLKIEISSSSIYPFIFPLENLGNFFHFQQLKTKENLLFLNEVF